MWEITSIATVKLLFLKKVKNVGGVQVFPNSFGNMLME